VDFDQLKND
jgi:hypothetical protein